MSARVPWTVLLALLAAGPVRAELLLYVGAANGGSVERFDTAGAFVDHFAVVDPLLKFPPGQSAFAYGHDGHFFVQGWSYGGTVRRYDGVTGAFRDAFVPSTNGLAAILFGPDSFLYTAGPNGGVNRYSGGTGEFLGQFVAPAGLGQVSGMRFGPDGHLYVHGNGGVRRHDGATGEFLGIFAAGSGSGGPGDILFGPDGNLYVADSVNHGVRRYDGQTGEFLGVFASGGGLDNPFGLAFGPDGDLFVTSHGTEEILRYDGGTGEFRGVFATTTNLRPTYLAFVDTAAVPEPAGLLLGAAGAGVLAWARRRGRGKQGGVSPR